MNRLGAVVAVIVAISGSVRADDAVGSPTARDGASRRTPGSGAEDGFLHQLADDVRAHLDAASHARARQPPVPIAVKWKPVRIDTIDLGAPLAALATGDLDGDGKSELYAVTSREVIAFSLAGGRAKELGRVAFEGDPAVPASRDLVGTAVVEGHALTATVSTFARSMEVTWQGKALVAARGQAGFVPCAGVRAELAAGRNYFGDAQTAIYAARCRTDLTDPAGNPLHVRATLALSGKLDVTVESCGTVPCKTSHVEFGSVGFAFEIADVDHDGRPELVYSTANAPGDSDVVKVVTIGADDRRPLIKRKFDGEGIAGIAMIDVDGNGTQEVVLVSRQFGASRVNLWRLD